MFKIGDRLKELRDELKFPQKYVSDKLGITERTLRKIESNEKSPTYNEIELFAKVYNIPVIELIGNIESQSLKNFYENSQDHSKNQFAHKIEIKNDEIMSLLYDQMKEKERIIESKDKIIDSKNHEIYVLKDEIKILKKYKA